MRIELRTRAPIVMAQSTLSRRHFAGGFALFVLAVCSVCSGRTIDASDSGAGPDRIEAESSQAVVKAEGRKSLRYEPSATLSTEPPATSLAGADTSGVGLFRLPTAPHRKQHIQVSTPPED